MKSICKSMGFSVWTTEEKTHEGSRLDYAIAGQGIKVKDYKTVQSLSDHIAITWDLEVASAKKLDPINAPDRRFTQEITLSNLLNPRIKDTQSFLSGIKESRTGHNVMKIVENKRRKDDKLIDLLIKLNDSTQVQSVVQEH